jgi:hypothetical protein
LCSLSERSRFVHKTTPISLLRCRDSSLQTVLGLRSQSAPAQRHRISIAVAWNIRGSTDSTVGDAARHEVQTERDGRARTGVISPYEKSSARYAKWGFRRFAVVAGVVGARKRWRTRCRTPARTARARFVAAPTLHLGN